VIHMLLRKEVLLEFIRISEEENQEMEEFKKRGKGRYVPELKLSYYMINLYAILISKRLVKMLERGDYSTERVIQSLKEQDWSRYSYKHGFDSEHIRKLLGKGKSTKATDLLDYQTVYLKYAADRIIEYIEE